MLKWTKLGFYLHNSPSTCIIISSTCIIISSTCIIICIIHLYNHIIHLYNHIILNHHQRLFVYVLLMYIERCLKVYKTSIKCSRVHESSGWQNRICQWTRILHMYFASAFHNNSCCRVLTDVNGLNLLFREKLKFKYGSSGVFPL